MAEEGKKKAGTGPAKIAAVVALFAGSITLMFHRMPHRKYAEVHEDKPRARPEAQAVAAAQAPKPAAPASAPAAPVAKIAAPSAVPSAIGSSLPAPLVALAASAAMVAADDWTDECRPEIGLLCHKVATGGLRSCLDRYHDALLKRCRAALAALPPEPVPRPSRKPVRPAGRARASRLALR
jgi:hypothetical protein